MIVADTRSEYGLDVDELSFAEFRPLLDGLLSADTRTWRNFSPQESGQH